MKRVYSLILLASLFLFNAPARNSVAAAESAPNSAKIRVLVVTGGHDFEREAFFKLFKENPELDCQFAEHPKAQAPFKPEAAEKYDVLVLYDLWQDISDASKKDFVQLLERGKGLVALHHCLASYQKWDQYNRIIGGKYYLQKEVLNGVEIPGSVYQHGVEFTVHVSSAKHPVIAGLSDFRILDETYGKFQVRPDVQPLLTTTEPTSSPTIAWAQQYEQSRVVYIELGHDHFAYENPNYQRLVKQAIRWTAKRESPPVH